MLYSQQIPVAVALDFHLCAGLKNITSVNIHPVYKMDVVDFSKLTISSIDLHILMTIA